VLDLTFVSEVTIASDHHIGSFRAGDDPRHDNGLVTHSCRFA